MPGSWALRTAPQAGLWLASLPEGSLVSRDGARLFQMVPLLLLPEPEGIFLFPVGVGGAPGGKSQGTGGCPLTGFPGVFNSRLCSPSLGSCQLELVFLPSAGVCAGLRARLCPAWVATAPSAPIPRAAPARCPPRLRVHRELRIVGQPRPNLPLHLTGAFRAPAVQHRPEGWEERREPVRRRPAWGTARRARPGPAPPLAVPRGTPKRPRGPGGGRVAGGAV